MIVQLRERNRLSITIELLVLLIFGHLSILSPIANNQNASRLGAALYDEFCRPAETKPFPENKI